MEKREHVGGRKTALSVPTAIVNIVMYQMNEENILKAEGIAGLQDRRRGKINLCF